MVFALVVHVWSSEKKRDPGLRAPSFRGDVGLDVRPTHGPGWKDADIL